MHPFPVLCLSFPTRTQTLSEYYFCPEMVEKLYSDPPTHPLCRRLCFAASSNPPPLPTLLVQLHSPTSASDSHVSVTMAMNDAHSIL